MARATAVERSVQNESVSQTVVSTVAEFTGSDPVAIEPLYDVVDPDALDALFETDRVGLDRSPSRVTFTYCGCEVVVSDDGTVRVSRSGQEVSREWE